MSATWFPTDEPGATALERVAELRPEYAAAQREVEGALWEQDLVEEPVLALCRRRVAQLLGAEDAPMSERVAAVALDPRQVDDLTRWPTSPMFSERERICLGFAEQLIIDSQGVTDEQAHEVIAAVGEGGFLVLTYACGFFETTLRAELVLADSGTAQ